MATTTPDPKQSHYRGILADADPVDDWEARIKRLDAVAADQAQAPVSANAESAAQTETPRMVTGYCMWCAMGDKPDENGLHHTMISQGTWVQKTTNPCTGEHAPGLSQAAQKPEELDRWEQEYIGDQMDAEIIRLTAERDTARAELAQARHERDEARAALLSISDKNWSAEQMRKCAIITLGELAHKMEGE